MVNVPILQNLICAPLHLNFTILQDFNVTFTQCCTSIHQVNDGQTEFSVGLNFVTIRDVKLAKNLMF